MLLPIYRLENECGEFLHTFPDALSGIEPETLPLIPFAISKFNVVVTFDSDVTTVSKTTPFFSNDPLISPEAPLPFLTPFSVSV